MKGHLQSAIDLQAKLNAIHARDLAKESYYPIENPNSDELNNRQPDCTQNIDNLDSQNLNIYTDSKGITASQHVKDHCEHCPETQPTQNPLEHQVQEKH